jgi:uncharacterized membrane protein YkvA (DUF1232 family)
MPDDRSPGETPGRPYADELAAAVAEDFQSFDSVRAESTAGHDSEAALRSAGDGLPGGPSKGLLSFYDRMRERVVHTVHRRGGRMPEGAVRALLLVPDVFILLVRLTLDKNVPKPTRAMIGGALAYFVLPFDLFPEGILGGIGYMDDLVLATAVLAQSFSGDLEPYARRHWSGSEDLRVVLRDISETAHALLGENLYQRLKGLLGRRGIEVEDGSSARRQDPDYDDD